MRPQIQWSGSGDPILFLPGWNTKAASVSSWLPPSFLEHHRCGILEWPGFGNAAGEPLPESLNGFLDAVEEALPVRPLNVVGFCLGGIGAWALGQRHPDSVRGTILVESALHFPLVFTPLLVPGVGRALLRFVQNTALGRHLLLRASLQRETRYSKPFLEDLFDFEASAALHYLRLFKAYGEALGSSKEPHPSTRACWQLEGAHPVKVLAPCWGHRHRVQSTPLSLAGSGHFPAVEAPALFFECIQSLLAGMESRLVGAHGPSGLLGSDECVILPSSGHYLGLKSL